MTRPRIETRSPRPLANTLFILHYLGKKSNHDKGFLTGTGPLVRLYSKIDATVYKEILKKHVPNLKTAINQPAVFMQDNAPSRTAKSVKTFLSEEDVTAMEWPAQSPEMNPIENV